MVKDIAISAGGRGFDCLAGQNGHDIGNGSPPLRCSFGAVLPRHYAVEMGLDTRYIFRRNTANVIKIAFDPL